MPPAIRIYGRIGPECVSAAYVKDWIETFRSVGVSSCLLQIDSPGGDADHAIYICNALTECDIEMTAIVEGECVSGATVIAMGCSTILARPNATFQLHDIHVSMGEAAASIDDLQAQAKFMGQLREVIVGIYEARTGLPKARISQLMREERTWSAAEAVQRGFVDGILRYDEPFPGE